MTVSEHASRHTLLRGPNFSGRTSAIAGAIEEQRPNGYYIGPDALNAFSGATSSVSNELKYFAGAERSRTDALRFLDAVAMSHLLQRNPVTLSGGEQVVAAIASAIAFDASVLGLDCCFEQLARELRAKVLSALLETRIAKLLAADNRIDEVDETDPIKCFALRKMPGTVETIRSELRCRELPVRARAGRPLSLRNVTASYGRNSTFALRVPRLDLSPGVVYRLCGVNGAGKTTLCKVLVGLLRASSGEIRVGDTPLDSWRHPGSEVVLSFQNPDDQLFESSLRSELLARSCPSELVAPMLGALGVRCPLETHPGSLPFVLRKRLGLAASLAIPKGWYIFDEPTLGQDERTVEEIAVAIRVLADAGAGVLVITHSEQFADFLRAETITLDKGVCEQG